MYTGGAILLILLAILSAILRYRTIEFNSMKLELDEQISRNAAILSQKKSSEVRTGQIAEQMVPFLKHFKHDPKNAHFIGQPIDYIVFNNDNITFVEVKSGKAALSDKQKHIKKLIENKQVIFETIRVE